MRTDTHRKYAALQRVPGAANETYYSHHTYRLLANHCNTQIECITQSNCCAFLCNQNPIHRFSQLIIFFAASTQETTASMQELNATINLLAESAGNLTKLSEDDSNRILRILQQFLYYLRNSLRRFIRLLCKFLNLICHNWRSLQVI